MSILKLKDSQGNWIGVPTIKGTKGDRGNGISSAVLNNDYTLTLTFTDGTSYTTSSIRGEKGEKGEPATDMDIHICSASEYDSETRIPTIVNPDDKTFYLVPTEDGTSPDLFTEWVYVNNAWEMFGSASVDLSGYLTDVKVNDTSIVENGVANVPVASSDILGVVKVYHAEGLTVNQNTNRITINTADDGNIKAGTNSKRPITSVNQHKSAFYGLAKASGHDEKDSTLPVGQYTDEAKSSIQDMLDVPSTSELKEIKDSKADVIVESASGDIVSFNDGADDMPLKSLVVDINPVQNLNGYDHPWVGGGGKNLLDKTTLSASTSTIQYKSINVGDGTFTCSSNAPWSDSNATLFFLAGDVSSGASSANNGVSPTNPRTQTAIDGYVTIAWRLIDANDPLFYNIQIESGSTATTYEPYENICPISGWEGMNVIRDGRNMWGGSISDSPSGKRLSGYGKTGGYPRLNKPINPNVYTLSVVCNLPSGKTQESWAKSNNIRVWFKSAIDNKWYDIENATTGALRESTSGGSVIFAWTTSPDITTTPQKFTSSPFKLTIPVSWIVLGFYKSGEYLEYTSVQLEVGESSSDIEAYNGQSIPISWQSEAGTVYGGQLDVLSGVMRVDRAMVDLGTLTWTKYVVTQGTMFRSILNTMKSTPVGVIIAAICSNYKSVSQSQRTNVTVSGTGTNVDIIDNNYSDVDTFKSAMSGVQLCYELAEPITIQLTPQQVNSIYGVNNIWADTGNTSVEYCADTEMYIEKVKPVVNVDDVQINGTSIVQNGIANIPIADQTQYGTVKFYSGVNGLRNSNGFLISDSATSSDVKTSTHAYKPITPKTQHESTFYGLAKASGDTTQSQSSNTVGNYTDNAKTSIQNMLGITDKYTPKEWITESETELVTNAHSVGDLFYIGETLYKVIADLNAGDAINVGVNVEEVDVNNILTDYATKEDVENNISIIEKSASGSIASFDDGLDNIPLKELVVDINPIQDLHGYDKPWIGGTGKNLFQTTMQSTTVNGVTVTVNSDGSVKFTGTPTGNIGTLVFGTLTLPAGTYKVNGFALGERTASRMVVASPDVSVFYANVYGGLDVEFTLTEETELRVYPIIGTSDYQDGETFYPMIRKASETDATFTPYENICPINGWTECKVNATGVNLFGGEAFRDAVLAQVPNAEVGEDENGRYIKLTAGASISSKVLIDNCFKPKTQYTFFFKFKKNNTNGMTNLGMTYVEGGVAYLNINEAVEADTVYSRRLVTTANKTVDLLRTIWASGTSSIYYDDFGIFEGDVSEYSPYTGRSITIDLGQTVYGAHLDVLSGVLTVDDSTDIYDGGESVTQILTANGCCVYTLPTVGALSVTNADTEVRVKTDKLKPNSASRVVNQAVVAYQCALISRDRIAVSVPDTIADTTAFKAWLAQNNLQVVYPLDTPITVQLSPTEVKSLLGANNIFADTGDTEVAYFSQVDEDLVDYIKANLNSYAKKDLLNDYVDDIQIDGTSIVENGIAEIPFATSNAGGVVKVDSSLGIKLNDTNKLLINRATTTQAKAGSDAARPIVPICQHESVFYGLTKAAGVDMASSSNAVGTYTDEAKTAIKQMLGIHDTIDSFVEEVSGTDVTITGQPSYRYNCGELYSLTVTPPSSGTIDIRFTSGSTPTVLTLPQTVKMPEWWVEVETNTIYEMCITDGIYCGVMTWAM